MIFGIGTRVRSKRNGEQGTVVGYGTLQWPWNDDETKPVYLVKVAEGSMSSQRACAVFRADLVEEVK